MTCPYTIDIGAYVLEALEPAEAQRLCEHLAGCPDCLPTYDELRGLPASLERLAPSDVDNMTSPARPPDAMCDQLLTRAVGRRGSRRGGRGRSGWAGRRVLGVAAAAVALVAGIATGLALPSGNHPAVPRSTTVAATDPSTAVHASITLTSQNWGTQIRLSLSDVQPAQQCMLVVVSADGRRDVAATWVATNWGVYTVTGTSALPVRLIREFDVITTSGERLVSVPPPAR
jgi:putative zinc finger protein